MKKIRELVFSILFFLLLFFILLNFGIHFIRTNKFNNQLRYLTNNEKNGECSFDIHFRGGATDSWLKRDVAVKNKVCTLQGSTFDGVFNNASDCEVYDWKLRIDFNESCYLNNSWCGLIEVHQKGKVQTVDLRNINRENLILDYCDVGQDFLIPLESGDYIIYLPSQKDGELEIRKYNQTAGSVTIGFIFYTDVSADLNIDNYSVQYKLKKGYFQGKEPVIFLVLLALWCLLLFVKVTVRIAYKHAEKEAQQQLNLQRMEDMKIYNSKLSEEVDRKTKHIKEIQQKVVLGLADVIGNRDPDTGGHVERTSDIIKLIVEEFRKQNPGLIDDVMANDICRAAPMHDLGKIYIDADILCKPARLTDEEFEKMKSHSTNSGEIVKLVLKDVEEPHFLNVAFNVARHHHERWDGNGYPDKLAGNAIPLEARLMAIADVYDALVSKRCYKQSMSFDKAFAIMCEGMGTQFDPQMKSVITACREKLENYYTENIKQVIL